MTVRQSDRAFGLTFGALFAVLFSGGWWIFGEPIWWLAVVAVVFAVIALAVPLALLPLNRLWFRLGGTLAVVSNHILLGLIFFGLIAPLGLVLRLIGKDLVQRRFAPAATTYLSPVTRGTDSDTLRDQF